MSVKSYARSRARFVHPTAVLLLCSSSSIAHEGHAPLPTKGATVQGNYLLLTEKARTSIGVESSRIALETLNRRVQARARIQLPWHQQAMISTLVTGRVASVSVRPGDHVAAGQELARIESLELETLRRDLLRAKEAKSLADKILAQRVRLSQTNAIAPADVSEARRDRDAAEADVRIAIRRLNAVGWTESPTAADSSSTSLPVLSPIKGIVVHADVRVGQVVATDEHLFNVVDLSEVEIGAEVLESDIPLIAVGQGFEATVTALPGKAFQGRINHSHLTVEPDTHALTVIGHIENHDENLKPGMTGLMSIQAGARDQVIACPSEAVIRERGEPFVILDRGAGRYERRPIKLGMSAGSRVEVLDGLFPGDRVVVTATKLLASFFGGPTARDATTSGSQSRNPMSNEVIVTQGELELPTDRKQFATSQVEGRIARILVHPGDKVRAGQILAEIESLPLRSLQLELLQARARLDWQSESAQRARALAERNAGALIDLWREETALEVIQQTIQEARMKLKLLGVDSGTLGQWETPRDASPQEMGRLAAPIPLHAPMDGQVEHFEVVPGQVVVPSAPGRIARPEKPLFEIHDRSKLWVCGHVREQDVGNVRVGQKARVSFPAFPERVVTGEVVRVSPVLETNARVLPIWIEIDNADGRLFEGMLARATIDIPTSIKSPQIGGGAR